MKLRDIMNESTFKIKRGKIELVDSSGEKIMGKVTSTFTMSPSDVDIQIPNSFSIYHKPGELFSYKQVWNGAEGKVKFVKVNGKSSYNFKLI